MTNLNNQTRKTQRNITCACWNARSIKNKIDEARHFINSHETHKIEILAITESWLGPSVPDTMIGMDNFQTPFRRDRNENGGGILVYISQQLSGARKKELENPELELMWVEIQFFTHRPLLLGCCYRPPNSTAAFFSKLEQVLEKVAEKDILLVGDFNAKHKDWFIRDNTNCNGQTLKDLMDRFDMTQLCSEATHLDNNGEPGSLLDLAFTNVPHLFNYQALVSQPISTSDHLPILIKTSITHQPPEPVKNVSKSWLYSQKDHVKMMNSFPFDEWSHVFQPEDDITKFGLDGSNIFFSKLNLSFPVFCGQVRTGQDNRHGSTIILWNDLPATLHSINTLSKFKSELRKHLQLQ